MVNDPIGDFIIQLKNAGMVKKERVHIPFSKLKSAIAERLLESGYVARVAKYGKKTKKVLEVTLSYDASGVHAIHGVKRVSKPGRRLYRKVADIHPIKFGRGLSILSTPHGILTGEQAQEKNVGGEELFIIW